ncbi:MAG TPA: tetratricopeptide repeat protein [Blastocatellia bacterium]|nr:tetratricopeptide repeat protein [Blastocatellia bacterium]
MAREHLDLAALEDLRESGDYEKIAAALSSDWHEAATFGDYAVRLRLLAAEIAGRDGRLGDMETMLAPYLKDVNHVPLGLAARALLMAAQFHYRRGEAQEALRLSLRANAIAAACEDDHAAAEAVQVEGQALWSLERWEEAAERFERTIALYAGQGRAYRLGLAHLCLGAVLNRMGKVEDARGALERGVKILLKFPDHYNLGVARVNVALALNATGEHETALRYLQFAYETFEHIQNKHFTYLTLNSIAATLICLKQLDKAEEYAARALEVGTATRSAHIASTYEIKARIYLRRREWERADRALHAALEIAEQANSRAQKAETLRTLGRLYLAQEFEEEAAKVLWQSLDIAQELQASLLALEVKSLLAQAVCATNPVEALKLIADVEAALAGRQLPELKKDALAARKRINALDREHYFILSDANMPLLADAKIVMLKWLWSRALYKARGNAREAAALLGVTPTYIRKLTKVIPRDLLRPGKKRSKRGGAGE